MSSFDSTLHIFCTCTVYPALYSVTTTFHSVKKKTETSCVLVKKLQFEAQTQNITDSAEGAEGVEADKPDIEVDEVGEDLDALDEVEVEDQAESGSLYESQTETETETETEDENGEKPKGLEHTCSFLT